MEKIDTVVIGAGAIGLAIAHELSKTNPDLVVVEKEKSFGRHTSSRNSEVIHAGHYYDTGSLKARLCVEGNDMLYDFLERHSLPHQKTGKIIVATSEDELKILDDYIQRGTANGCKGFELLTQEEVNTLEPQAKCIAGLHIPSTGIFDTHLFMEKLADLVEEQGAFIVYDNDLIEIEKLSAGYILRFANGEAYQCCTLINSGGLWADQIAGLAGIDIDSLGIRQYWCKGQYYKSTKISGIKRLIYPVADPKGIFLGIHLTINLAGEIRLGPNAYKVDDFEYRFEESYFEE